MVEDPIGGFGGRRIPGFGTHPSGLRLDLWIEYPNGKFWVALSYVGNGPTVQPAQWVVSVAPDGGLNLLKHLFGKPDRSVMERLCQRIRKVLEETEGIRIVESHTGQPG